MKNLFLICFIVCNISGHAQTIFSNAVWHYGVNGSAPNIFYSTQIKAQNDTIINGHPFTAFDLYLGNKPNRIYLREQDNILYFFFRNSERTLFNFNASVNDTITLDILSDYSNIDTTLLYEDQKVLIRQIVDVANPVTGEPLKRFVYEFIDLDRGENQYGITQHILHERSLTGNIFSLIDDDEAVGGVRLIRCFESDSLNFKDIGFYQSQKPCDYSNDGLNELNSGISLSIFPNPAHDEVNLYFEKGFIQHITIYSLTGKRIADYNTTGKLHQENIDVSTLKPGLYQCIIETDAGKTAMQLSIK